MRRKEGENTSFFLKLENSRQTANTIYKIKNKDGEIVHDNRDILNVTENYYSTGLIDNNPEQIRNKLKISAYVLETT